MFHFLLGAVLLSPFIGIVLMERGTPALNFLTIGYRTYAAEAFLAFVVVLIATYLGLWQFVRPRGGSTAEYGLQRGYARYPTSRFIWLATSVIALNAFYTVLLFYFAGVGKVLAGEVGRGEFRSTLGGYAVFAYLARDFLAPMAAAVVAFVYLRTSRSFRERAFLFAVLGVTSLGSAVWGYKTGALTALFPAVTILLPRLKVRLALPMISLALAMTIAFAAVFEGLPPREAAVFTLTRATIGAGDSPWKLWAVHDYIDAYPEYLPTLSSALGGRLGSLLGVFGERGGLEAYERSFAGTSTWVVTDYAPVEASVSNVTSTAFGEGVMALGSPGYLLFAILGGVLLALCRRGIDSAHRDWQPAKGALVATYFTYSVWGWLNSGGLITLFNLPHVVSYFLAWSLCRLLLSMAGIAPSRRLHHHEAAT